jgi:hypothetical protein
MSRKPHDPDEQSSARSTSGSARYQLATRIGVLADWALTTIDISTDRIGSCATGLRFDQPYEAEAKNEMGYEYCHS